MTRFAWLSLPFVLLAPTIANAQSGGDAATAQALFDEGKRLMQDKHYDEACPKLVESQRLDPGGGTLLAIALCHEAEGKLATAWGDFGLAASEARKDHRADRESAATSHAHALEPRLTRARIVVATPVDGLEVMRDGRAVGSAEWGMGLPIDAGDHAFEAHAPGKTPWRQTVTFAGEGKTIDVAVPALADDVKAVAVPPPPPAPVVATPAPAPLPPPPSAAPPPDVPHGSRGAGLRAAGFVTGAVGLVAVGVGAGFGAAAISNWNSAHGACPGNVCRNASDAQQGASAGTSADVSTVLFVVGGVAVAAGLTLVLVAPKSHPSTAVGFTPTLRVSPLVGVANGIALGGTL